MCRAFFVDIKSFLSLTSQIIHRDTCQIIHRDRVNKQRMEYNKRIDGKKKSSLNDSRLERLQSLGFRWAKRKGQASWENHFDALVAYKAENGHCSVPTKYKEDTALGRWVSTQRAEYKKYSEGEPSQITADKIKRLEDVGFAWWMGV